MTGDDLCAVVREHRWFLAVVALEGMGAIAAHAAGAQLLHPSHWSLGLFLTPLIYAPVWLGMVLAWDRLRGRHPWRVTLERFRAARPAGYWISGVLVAVVLMVETLVHDDWKSSVGRIRPYSWDATLTRWDRLLHGGRLPWEWLQPLLGHPPVTRAIDVLYAIWFAEFAIAVLWMTWSTDRRLRARFLLTWVSMFALLGSAAAIIFASGGPCFYAGLVGPPDPYAPLMAYLHQVDAATPLLAVRIQNAIWQNYLAGEYLQWVGMSAMPSLHVGVATMVAAAGWERDRRLGLALATFALLIFLGSVHLGWHYAVDGYAAVGCTLALWWASVKVLR